MQLEVIIFLFVLLGLTISSIIYNSIQRSRNNASEKTLHKPQVVEIKNAGLCIRVFRGYYFNTTGTCDVTFQSFDDGKKITLRVPIDELSTITKGSVGALTLQGTRYISFTVNDEI